MNSTLNTTELISSIKKYNILYRNGTPLISDSEYDELVDKLKSALNNEDFNRIRVTLTEDGGNIKHPYVMGSLDKIKICDTKNTVSEWIKKNVALVDDMGDGIFVSSKIDGCSARLSYRNGELISASTRGDGYNGVDIFSKVSLFAPVQIKSGFTGEIRGEVTLTHETLQDLSNCNGKQYKNLRNATAGLINSKDATDEEMSYLRFFAYEIMGETHLSKGEQFTKLKKLGFETALNCVLDGMVVGNITDDSVNNALTKIYNDFIKTAPYDIDGLVITDINNSEAFENKFIPENTVAVKFNQMSGETTLIDVVWNVSKSGKLCPVGVIEPINLGGSTISNVTLNNLNYIKEMGLTYGCRVSVLKSGDVIPKIIDVHHNGSGETAITLPTHCPSCNSELVYEENGLFPMCKNSMCDDIVYNKMLHFITHLDIKHVSVKTLEKFGIKTISDLINLKPDGGLVKAKFYDSINKKMFGASKEDLLMAFDYEGVSSQIISKMLSHYGYDKLVRASYDELSTNKPYGVGDKFLIKFINGFNIIKGDFFNILSNERYYGESSKSSLKSDNVENGVLSGMGFVVTGNLNTMSREEFKKTVIGNGGIYQSSVTKKTKYLVANDTSSNSSKIKKAISLGIMVIDENKFLKMVKECTDGFSIF